MVRVLGSAATLMHAFEGAIELYRGSERQAALDLHRRRVARITRTHGDVGGAYAAAVRGTAPDLVEAAQASIAHVRSQTQVAENHARSLAKAVQQLRDTRYVNWRIDEELEWLCRLTEQLAENLTHDRQDSWTDDLAHHEDWLDRLMNGVSAMSSCMASVDRLLASAGYLA